MPPFIESAKNPWIKDVLTLMEKPKERRDRQLFVVEGAREVSAALANGFKLQTLYYLPQLIPDPCRQFKLPEESPCRPVSLAVYKKIAYREGTEGVVAVMHQKNMQLDQLRLPDNPLILITEAIEKPGNMGAMLRTADAAQVDAVFVCHSLCDPYNPNLIRASLGAVFTRQIVACSAEEAIAWLRQNHITLYAATLKDAVPYHSQDYRAGCAIAVGSEACGLSPVWPKAAKACIHIPMKGSIDSLNVSVSAAILVFEAIKQRTSDT
ncbi:MAG: RNA methyltransferase [Bacteroidales bacterium]|nr:RNA methyltransferase [Bacteroidales bacterium]MCL2737819.1 RNA methyltransferase [Bacteroidales bacterium]